MSGIRIIRKLQNLIDVNSAAIGDGKVPVYRTAVSSHQYELGAGGGGVGLAASNTTYTSGTVVLSGSNLTVVYDSATVVISGPAPQTAISGLSASDTVYTSGTVALSGVGGGITVSSNTGQRIDLSVAAPVAQTVQTQNVVVPAASNTTYTSGTVVLSGGANVTVGTNGQTVTISAAAQTAQTGISSIAASDATFTSGQVQFTGSNMVTVKSGAGQKVVIDATQTVQTQNLIDVSLGGNTDGALALISSGTLTLAGGNNVTLSQAGNAVTISAASIQADTQTAISGLANSETTFTSGTVSLSELGAITIRSTTGNQFQLSVNSQTVQTQNLVDVTLAGNTTGTLALVSSGTLSLAGGNNITLSQNGNAVTISAASQSVQAETQTFVGGIQNSQTTYTSGTVNLSVVGGNMTIRSTTGNALQFSVSQSVQPETQTFLAGIQNSDTTYTSGTVNLSVVGGNMTIRSTTGNALQFSVSQSVQAETQTAISGIVASDATYTSGTVSIAGVGGGITVSSNTGQRVDLSVAAQSVESQSIGMSNIGNTSGTTGVASGGQVRFALAGGNNITLSQSLNGASGTITISAFTQTAESNTFGISNLGNTAGTSGTIASNQARLLLAGGNNITVSQSTNGGSATITISGPNAATGISGIQNSETTYTSGTVLFSQLGAITIRSTTGNAYQFSVNSQTVQTQSLMSVGVSTGGNTAGSTGVTGTRMVFVGSSPVSLSQATDASGGTISINAPATSSLSATGQVSISTNASTISIGVPNPLMSFSWQENPLVMAATQGIGNSGASNTTVTAWVMPVSLPADLAFNNLNLAVHNSFTTATTSISSVNYSYSMGASLGFYTLNVSTMSLVTSFSGSLGYTNATAVNATNMSITARYGLGGSSSTVSTQGAANISGVMSSIESIRKMGLNWTTVGQTLTRGNYFAVGCFSQLTGGNNQAALSQIGFASNMTALGSAWNPPEMLKSTASVTSPYPFLGLATLVNSSNSLMPVSFNTSVITTATAIANSTNFQSLWMQAHSSHSN